MEIIAYNLSFSREWDNFIADAKNGHFMFFRDYMDYHKDRFVDASLMIYSKDKLIALFPANIQNNVIYSHQGLTFGSLITSCELKTAFVLDIFNLIVSFYQQLGITKIIYKTIPHIYHKYPAEEDLYALYRLGATLIRRDISSTILVANKIPFSESRASSFKKSIKNKLFIEESCDFNQYWDILERELLTRHHCAPTHTVAEIKFLAKKFPENIKLFIAYSSERKPLAGVVIYLNGEVAHTQYMIAGDEGKKNGALDLIIDYLINDKYSNKKWFDFGISTENSGLYLNEGLIFQKEGFGGRAIAHDFYSISVGT